MCEREREECVRVYTPTSGRPRRGAGGGKESDNLVSGCLPLAVMTPYLISAL